MAGRLRCHSASIRTGRVRKLDLDLAGMLSHGKLGRRLPLPEGGWSWVSRDVQLVTDGSGPALRWDARTIGQLRKDPRRWQHALDMSASTPDVLDAFVALADAGPERVLAFVRKYGRLELCKHLLPRFHASSSGLVA